MTNATPIPGRMMIWHPAMHKKGALTHPGDRRLPKGVARGTFVFQVGPQGEPLFGVARCSHKDVFSRARGRDMAMLRKSSKSTYIHPQMKYAATVFLERCGKFFGYYDLLERYKDMIDTSDGWEVLK